MSARPALLRKASAESDPQVEAHVNEAAPAALPDGLPRFLSDGRSAAKLEVGGREDPLEREADAVAEAVVEARPSLPRFLAATRQRDARPAPEEEKPPVLVDAPSAEPAPPLQRKSDHRVDPPDDGETGGGGGGAADEGEPDHSAPLPPPIKGRLESALDTDLAAVRVHQGDRAAGLNARLGARAFTAGHDIWLGARERSDDLPLMAHETAHVLQQARGDRLVRRKSGGEVAADGGNQSFAFSEDEMEARLGSTPGEGASTSGDTMELAPGTKATLGEVEQSAEGEAGAAQVGNGTGEGGGGGEGGEGAAGEAGKGAAGGGERAGPESAGMAGGGGEAGAGGGVAQPGPAAEFEGLVGERVAAYLDGNLSNEGLAALDPQTLALLDAAEAIGERSITDPEAAAMRGLGGEPLQAGEQRTGYENEPLWLRTLAGIRDVCGQLGGIVGIIGLAATVSGFILSLLIPPVGAFLLTVGRFCDVAALILDGVSLVLGIILTGYNYYRLKNETDPEERRRLLGMVRQDAMGTVMSAVAVATAVAPGAGRLLGRAGQRVSRGVRALSRTGGMLGRGARGLRVAGVSARLAMRAGGRGVRALGRGAAAGFRRLSRSSSLLGRAARGLRVAGASGRLLARGARRAVAARGRQLLGWARGTAPVRWANRLGGQAEEYARRRLRTLATSDSALGRFYNRRVRGIHERNVMLARSISDPVERAYQQRLGREMIAELDSLRQANPGWSAQQLDDALRERFGRERYGHAEVGTSRGGNIQFVRDDAAFLREIRETEFAEMQLVRDRLPPGASPREVMDAVNQSPFVKGVWTEDEIRAFMNLNPTRRATGELAVRDAAGQALAVSKTGHHTIPAGMAPQIAQDPRFIQVVSDSRSYRDFIDDAYPGLTHVPEVSGYMVPGVRKPLRQATSRREVIEDMLRGGQIPGYTPADINYFMGRELADDLVVDGSSGVWRNRRVAGQQMFFNPHLGIGHEWNWKAEIARQVFDMDTRLGLSLRRELGEQLFLPAVKRSGRLAAGSSGDGGRAQAPGALTARVQALIDRAVEARAAGVSSAGQGPAPARPDPVSRLLEPIPTEPGLGHAATAEAPPAEAVAAMPEHSGADMSALPATGEATPLPEVLAEEGLASAAPLADTAAPGPAGGASEPPAEPPSPVPYSPQALVSIREQRIDIAGAIEVVNDYIGETSRAEHHNLSARGAAAGLQAQNVREQDFATAERATVAAQQGKLEQASGAQQDMATQGSEAKSDAARGEQEGNSVQADGQSVSVEPKPEEPRSRSWLERAWDATAGAVYDRLVAPAVRAVRRKVSQVMASINEFIMGMINQALGLDEIEAEINGGGEDIAAREGSLGETDAGLEAVEAQAADEQARNQQSMDQADMNVEDARATREDARALRGELRGHDEVLAAEEMAGRSYIVDFESTYRPWFEPQADEAETQAVEPPQAGVQTGPGPDVTEESQDDDATVA